MDEVITELKSRHERRNSDWGIDQADLDRWCASTRCSRRDLLNGIAARLAIGFSKNDLTFEFCDHAVNSLTWVVYSERDPAEWPELFWRTYLAFDGGEYTRAGRSWEDPIKAYTKPGISLIIEEYGLAGGS